MRNHGPTTGTNADNFRRLEVITGIDRRRRWSVTVVSSGDGRGGTRFVLVFPLAGALGRVRSRGQAPQLRGR
jgi:hypothetical protein